MAGRRITTAGAIRVAMLVLVALICLVSAVGVADPDLWIPFVCIIAVMGIGTRGGVLDKMSLVLIEAFVVVILGVATFSGSRDFIWAASVAVSVLAVGKIVLLELTSDRDGPEAATPREPTPGSPARAEERGAQSSGRHPVVEGDAQAPREALAEAEDQSRSGAG
jgi:hypothetical protein